jgi:hypothetical protein
MRANFPAFFEDVDIFGGKRRPTGRVGGSVVILDEIGKMEGAGQAGGSGTDDQNIGLKSFALYSHWFFSLAEQATGKLRGVHIWRTIGFADWENLLAAGCEVLSNALRLPGRNTVKIREIGCANRAASGIMRQGLRIALGVCLTAFLASSTLAQYGGGTGMGTTGTPGTPGYVAPKSGYGSGKAIGIGVGAAAAGAGVLFLAMHHHGAVTGCVRQTDDGLRLVDEKKNKSYALEPGNVAVKPGDRVELKGKKSSGNGGAEMFEPTKVVKNLGSCGPEAAH